MSQPEVTPGRGGYCSPCKEGRRIGSPSKSHAHDLQDLGHNTVTANIIPRHGADELQEPSLEIPNLERGATGMWSDYQLMTQARPGRLRRGGLKAVEQIPMIRLYCMQFFPRLWWKLLFLEWVICMPRCGGGEHNSIMWFLLFPQFLRASSESTSSPTNHLRSSHLSSIWAQISLDGPTDLPPIFGGPPLSGCNTVNKLHHEIGRAHV